jgi:hypothetical protein
MRGQDDMDKDPYTTISEQSGCDSCGKRGVIFYAIEYYILPSKLVKKRHRDKSQASICCRDCFEADTTLPVQIDGVSVAIPKERGHFPKTPADSKCVACGDTRNLDGLYGLITKTLFMDGSIIESAPLARFCSSCVERKEVVLLRGAE